LLNRLGTLVVPFFTIYLTSACSIAISQATFIVSLFGIGSFGASLSGGILADSIGRRTTMIVGLSSAALTTIALALVHPLLGIAVLTLVLGFSTDLYRPASAATIADIISPFDRNRAFNLLYWVINVGAAFALILGGLLARTSYLVLFITDALTTLAFCSLIWFGVPETRPHITKTASPKFIEHRIADAIHDPLLLGYTVLAFLFACIFFQGYVTLPLDMRAHGMSELQYGVAIAMNGLIIVLFSIPVNTLLARFPPIFALSGAALLMGTGFGLTGVVHTVPLYALSVVVWTFGELMAAPVTSTIIANLSPIHMRGVYQGIYGTAWGLASFAGPALGGLVLSYLGASSLWLGCFALGIVIAFGYILLARKTSYITKETITRL
jgi:MFS family permease